jgi:hypothetical protein
MPRHSFRSLTASSSIAAILPLVLTACLLACPKEKPHDELCPNPSTTTRCSSGSCFSPNINCPQKDEQKRIKGPFGCEDNSPNQTECINGLSEAQCFDKYDCKCFGTACLRDSMTKETNYEVVKIQDPCNT